MHDAKVGARSRDLQFKFIYWKLLSLFLLFKLYSIESIVLKSLWKLLVYTRIEFTIEYPGNVFPGNKMAIRIVIIIIYARYKRVKKK